jgi:hypothetical protein
MMQEHGVAPRDVPTYTVSRENGKNLVVFTPSVIWIIGANGRVDVKTSTRRHILVDLGGTEGKPSRWRLVDLNARGMLRPLNRQTFLALLKE